MMKRNASLLLALLLCACTAHAKIQLPQLFQSGMVLQRGKPIPVWGVADPGETVIIRWQRRQYSAVADAHGQWRIDLPKMKAGGPYTMMVGEQALTDILVGDVWLCSGQSNMDIPVGRVYPQYAAEIDHYQNDRIRLFRVQTDKDTHGPKADVLPTRWTTLSKANAWNFSAIGYFLCKRMYEQTGVPQAAICNSLGGTPIEAWIPADSLVRDFPVMVRQTRLYQDDAMVQAQAEADRRANNQWYQLLNEADPFPGPDFQPINQYELPQFLAPYTQDGQFIGSVYVRQQISVSKERAGKPARLLLGTLFDQDYTFVNGQEVGRTYYQYPPRRYDIPAGLLHEGINTLLIRFVNKYGIPHFIEQKPYMIIFGEGDTLHLSEQWQAQVGALMPPPPPTGTSIQNLPSVLYNAMLHPLAPYGLSGVVWYQGESNTGHPTPYASLLRLLMSSWRARWVDTQLPFVIVELANFMQSTDQPQQSNWARVREAQRTVAKTDARAEYVVTIDVGETVDIHPLRKKEVAQRVALCFDRLVYGKTVLLTPEVVRTEVDGSVVRLTFDQPLRSGQLFEWELAGSDGRYVNAEAVAEGRTVTLTSPIPSPRSVRHAWKDNPLRFNSYSSQGLPLSPFELKLE